MRVSNNNACVFRAGQQLQVYNIELKTKMKQHVMTDTVSHFQFFL